MCSNRGLSCNPLTDHIHPTHQFNVSCIEFAIGAIKNGTKQACLNGHRHPYSSCDACILLSLNTLNPHSTFCEVMEHQDRYPNFHFRFTHTIRPHFSTVF